MAACPSVFDALRMKTEDLGPRLYVRASYREPDLNLYNRSEYPQGAGLSRSVFTIQRSEPDSEEEAWRALTSLSANSETGDACKQVWAESYVGHLERKYGPSVFQFRGPLTCVDELVLNWNSRSFWTAYYAALEKNSLKRIAHRLANEYWNFIPVTGCYDTLDWTDPFHFHSMSATVIIPPRSIDITDVDLPTSELMQWHLDRTAVTLIQEGATDPDSDGWITMGPQGPVFPLLIGMDASDRIVRNNADLVLDIRSAWTSMEEANPLLRRLGATLILKNFRHVITPFPPRWDWRTTGTDGSAIGPAHLYTEPTSGLIYGYAEDATEAIAPWAQQVHNGGCYVRRPVFTNSTDTDFVTKGKSPEVNTNWEDARYEGARVLTPWVMNEQIIRPFGDIGNMRWGPQNYSGEWAFVTGNDALLADDLTGCTGTGDPLHKKGRHFAEYRHAVEPVFPQYGRGFIFDRRCQKTAGTTVLCSS